MIIIHLLDYKTSSSGTCYYPPTHHAKVPSMQKERNPY